MSEREELALVIRNAMYGADVEAYYIPYDVADAVLDHLHTRGWHQDECEDGECSQLDRVRELEQAVKAQDKRIVELERALKDMLDLAVGSSYVFTEARRALEKMEDGE